ncbi:hypothetical protein [Mesorhizobium sp. WSM3626]|uniref:hypothetical protein n=1 Tax=Mesorhizobium sp. WSM3626 TaxID=1040987 RepID=UPI0004AD8C76|nr:hypothetical protein [Mesorhizobium sp. WSM3626]
MNLAANGLNRRREIVREIWLFIGVLVFALLLMMLFPEIVLWLPRQFRYQG